MKTKRAKHPRVPPTRVADEIRRKFRHRERAKEAYYLPGAAAFSDDELLRDAPYILAAIQSCDEIWPDLERETTEWVTYERRHDRDPHLPGRKRAAGHPVLAACAWVLSGEDGEMEPWRVNRRSLNDLWSAAGYTKAPARSTWHERLVELEDCFIEGIYNATAKLWEIAQAADPNVGRHWRVDGRTYESHARLEHRCLDPVECKALGGRPKRFVDRAAAEQFAAKRQDEAKEAPSEELPEDELEEETTESAARDPWDVDEDLEEWAAEHGAAEQALGRKMRIALERARNDGIEIDEHGNRVIWLSGHRYICRDPEAGYRLIEGAGKRKRAWLGGNAMALNDPYLDIEAYVHHFPADEQEEGHHYVQALKGLRRIIGANPEAIVFDRGPPSRYDREINNRLGIATVSPFRKPTPTIESRHDLAKPGYYDGYGFSRCRHCNSPGHTHGDDLGFILDRQRIAFLCANPHTEHCNEIQYQDVNEEPLLLGVIEHDDPLYYALRQQGKPGEHTNSNSRRRYGTDGKNADTRAKRIGTAFMRLRAAIACFLDIFRVCLRRGWIGQHERLHTSKPIRRDGSAGAEAMERLRAMHGLLLPYGPEAERLGLVYLGENVPEGWKPVKQRRNEAKKAREKERDARLRAELRERKRLQEAGLGPPRAAAA